MWWNTRIRYRMDQLLYIVCLLIFQTIECSLNVKRYDICKPFTQKRVYTAIGSRGTIYAKHDISIYSKLQNDSFHKQCSLHILSCPSCMINIRFKDVDLPCTYDKSGRELVCNSICFVEPPFSIRSLKCVNGTVHNSSIYYKSLTSQVNINYYLNRQPRGYAFTAEYLITRNTQLAEVKPDFNSANISFGGYVSTPFFPVSYPDDLTFEQVINCKLSVCLIHLIFVDFQIAEESIVEFYDSNRKRLGIIGGITFRPPVVLSSGPVLYIKFFANAGSSIGYKAKYSYVRGSAKNSILKPNTNCGGFVENKGGAITMMHMVEEFEPDVLFDCIWLFRISHKYYHLKSQHLYMKVITLKDLVDSSLVIQEGLTSTGRILQWKNGSHFVEVAVPIDVGYYVRLTGTFNSSSRLEIAYAAFSQSRICSATNEFLCNNGRCIPNRLKCDGFDHCGDNSDESADCFEAHDSESEYMDKSWYAYKSNYYFPNNNLYSKRYHILLGCFIGFIIFFIIVLLAVYRIATCYHFQTDFQNRLISISQLLLEGIQLENNSPTSERGRLNSNYLIDEPPAYEPPPDYEAPPNYEEAVKMYKELMKQKDDNLNMGSVDMQSNRNSLVYNVDINNYQISSIVNLPDNEISSPHCLCCSKASYFIQALNINHMNNCCLSKIYSLRSLTINNEY